MIYNQKRAASLVATEDSVVFGLSKNLFNDYVKDASIGKRQKYEALLKKVPVLKPLYTYDRESLCDVLEAEEFKDGDTIIREGDRGEKMYIVETGTAEAYKDFPNA